MKSSGDDVRALLQRCWQKGLISTDGRPEQDVSAVSSVWWAFRAASVASETMGHNSCRQSPVRGPVSSGTKACASVSFSHRSATAPLPVADLCCMLTIDQSYACIVHLAGLCLHKARRALSRALCNDRRKPSRCFAPRPPWLLVRPRKAAPAAQQKTSLHGSFGHTKYSKPLRQPTSEYLLCSNLRLELA